MSYREYCDLCSESYDDDNLTTCQVCNRWFCYRCGSCGEHRCLVCLATPKSSPAEGLEDGVESSASEGVST